MFSEHKKSEILDFSEQNRNARMNFTGAEEINGLVSCAPQQQDMNIKCIFHHVYEGFFYVISIVKTMNAKFFSVTFPSPENCRIHPIFHFAPTRLVGHHHTFFFPPSIVLKSIPSDVEKENSEQTAEKNVHFLRCRQFAPLSCVSTFQ